MPMFARPVAFVNASVVVPGGTASSIRFASQVLSVDAPPRRGDLVVDLEGAFVLPGLINAHDHLELNHYGPLKGRDRYGNASEWIDDMRPRLQADASIRANRAQPLGSRLFIGGLKNLLAGATTVAHHNPRYREIGARFPVRVVRRYGWAHSFLLEQQPAGARGEPGGEVRRRYRATPADVPFIVHVAEGVDEAAGIELGRLQTLGCLRRNTVLVHGVAISSREWPSVAASGASLVWCPASNLFLFGRTAPVRQFLDLPDCSPAPICLGTDSRVTGARDLLDEMRAGASAAPVAAAELLRMVTTAAARILRLSRVGTIAPGAHADLVVVPPTKGEGAEALLEASRSDLLLVAIGGRPMVAAPSFAAVFRARRTSARPIVVDGVQRIAEAQLARGIANCPIREPGVACG